MKLALPFGRNKIWKFRIAILSRRGAGPVVGQRCRICLFPKNYRQFKNLNLMDAASMDQIAVLEGISEFATDGATTKQRLASAQIAKCSKSPSPSTYVE